MLDRDTVDQCAVALAGQRARRHEKWLTYAMTGPRFGGANVLEVDATYGGRAHTVRCTVAAVLVARGDLATADLLLPYLVEVLGLWGRTHVADCASSGPGR
ncbi:hypothetical protein EKO23_09545 [Nocardioides guangzhouensis]|uniref:Uncharacterized protein n=1 Tax=Nocardioides guangzhouensis TaxID=2497878 RepID=A0A4Q4ZFL1_9ACTN|nr:hypothetical protein [Nocardioides guangzhouensis]RYP86196.1 hypothetical protein EKO23_09545 [Nocardioides guangzhouensis]